MEISLSDFSYYFGLTGNSGGLASMEMEFRPYLYKGQKIDDIKAAARGCIDKYMEVLDPLYNDVLDGTKEPQLTDSPYLVSTGYQYTGRFKKRWLRSPVKGLRAIFGEVTPEPHGNISVYANQDVTILYSFYKDVTRLNDVTVKIRISASHVLNVYFFQFTRGLEGIRIEQKARVHMQQLEETLKIMTERKDVDYYDMMTRKLDRDTD